MHPILFRIPLPIGSMPYAWVPYIIAVIAALYAASQLIGVEKDKRAAIAGGIVAILAIGARFVLKGPLAGAWDLGVLPIYSYGVMLGLSLVVGWYLTLGLCKRDGLPADVMANCYVVTAVAAVAGSRILYILTNLPEFTEDPTTHQALPWDQVLAGLFAMRRGGLVAYGGFLGGLLGSVLFLRAHKIPLFPWADAAVPSLASGLMITRVGCYLFGCDFGQTLSDKAPGFLKQLGTFPHWDKAQIGIDGSPAWQQHVSLGRIPATATASLPVHPTQIYESLVGAGILALLLWARRRQKFRGEIFFLFFFAYGVCRYLLEIIRDDAERGSIPPSMPEQQLIPFGLVVFAIAWGFGFSQAIKNQTVRRVTQVLAYLPAVLVFLALQPAPGTFGSSIEYSTSQVIALVTGVGGAAAFSVFYKASLVRPKQAMALNLPPEYLPQSEPEPKPRAEPDPEDGEEDREASKPAPKPKAKPGKKKKPKAAPPPEPEPEPEPEKN